MENTKVDHSMVDTSSLDAFKQSYVRQIHNTMTVGDSIMNLIIDKGAEIIYSHYLSKKFPKHNSAFIVDVFEQLAAQEVRAYDPGEPLDSLIVDWAEEEEPEPIALDSWSRLAVKVNQPEVESSHRDSSATLNSFAETQRSKRMHSFKRAGSARSLKKLLDQADSKKKNEKPKKEQIDVKFYKVPGFERYVDDDQETGNLRQEREDQKRLKEEAIKAAKQQIIDDKQKEEKKKNLERQVKNKEYTYDFEGNPIFLTRVIQPSKLPDKGNMKPDFDLESSIKVMKCLPDEPPVREEKKDDNKKVSLSIARGKKGGDEFLLPVVGDFAQMLDVKPGVRAQIDALVKMGPEIKNPEKMRRADYLKNLDERKNEMIGQYKRHYDPDDPENAAILEDEEDPETMMNKMIEAQLRKLGSLNKLTDIEIHEQEKFIQMLLDDVVADPRHAVEERKRREKILKKIEQMKLDSEDAKRASIIENRIMNYRRKLSGLPVIEPLGKPSERASTAKTPVKPSKIHQGLDNYNRKLLEHNAWDQSKHVVIQPQTPPSKAPKVVGVDQKSAMKTSIFDGLRPKEPRERATVAQKKIMETKSFILSSPAKGEAVKDKISSMWASPEKGLNVTKYAMRSSYSKSKNDKEGDRTNDSIAYEKTKIVVGNSGVKVSRRSVGRNPVNQSLDIKSNK